MVGGTIQALNCILRTVGTKLVPQNFGFELSTSNLRLSTSNLELGSFPMQYIRASQSTRLRGPKSNHATNIHSDSEFTFHFPYVIYEVSYPSFLQFMLYGPYFICYIHVVSQIQYIIPLVNYYLYLVAWVSHSRLG